ncbi:hypothetical protein ACUXVY_16390 [Chromobacterium haemolyticum]|uniref:hypothetical protein n=1 Tax=Chromobacterium haemolyticum TaxID=394935 RepID=UPI00405648A9
MKQIAKWFTLLSFISFQLAYPYYAYADVVQTVKAVLLSAQSSTAGRLTGTVMGAAGRSLVGLPVLGMALSMNDAGSADYDCMVAINPSCLPSPDGWPRDGTGRPIPPSTQASVPAKFPKADGSGRDSSYYGNSSIGTVYCVSGTCWVWLPDDASPPSGFTWMTRQAWYNKYQGSDGSTPDLQPSCPPGYTLNGADCNISVPPAQVMKPSTTPCSIVAKGNSYSFDSQNPSCPTDGVRDNGNGTFSVVKDDNVKVYNSMVDMRADKPSITVVPNADGSTTVKQYFANNDTTISTTVKDGVVKSQTTESGNTANTGSGTGTGTGTGAGTGTGTGTKPTDITCEKVGTCGVAQDSTLKGIASSMSDFFKNFTTVVQVPQIYTPNKDTFRSKFDSFRASIIEAPFVRAVSSFFVVSIGGGSCPVWTIPAVSLGLGMSLPSVSIDQFCSPAAQTAYRVMWWVFNAVAAFFAFRIAVE